MKEMVSKTQFAITGEDTRYFLNGALFVMRPDSMSLVATDGHRLALVTVPRNGKSGKSDQEDRPILPKKTLASSAGCSPKATATFSSSGARITCSSRSAIAR